MTVTVPGTKPVTAAAGAAAGASTAIRRTPDGKPDFSGVYGWANLFGGRGGGAAPALKPGAEKYRVTRGPLDTGATSDCLPLIPPNSFGVPYEFQFIQNKDYLVIFHEYPGTFRIIPLDGEPHQADPDPSWLGDSVGHWEGDTLVVDTIGYNEGFWMDRRGSPTTEKLHTLEKFTRTNDRTIHYETLVDDPGAYTKPWSSAFDLRWEAGTELFEYVCQQMNYAPNLMVGAAKSVDRTSAIVP